MKYNKKMKKILNILLIVNVVFLLNSCSFLFSKERAFEKFIKTNEIKEMSYDNVIYSFYTEDEYYYYYRFDEEPIDLFTKKIDKEWPFEFKKNQQFEINFVCDNKQILYKFDKIKTPEEYRFNFEEDYYFCGSPQTPMIFYPKTCEMILVINLNAIEYSKIHCPLYREKEHCFKDLVERKTVNDLTFDMLKAFYSNYSESLPIVDYFCFDLDEYKTNFFKQNIQGEDFCFEKNLEFEEKMSKMLESEEFSFYKEIEEEYKITFDENYYCSDFPLIYYPERQLLIIIAIY